MILLKRYPTVAMFLSFFISSCVFAYCSLPAKIILGSGAIIFAIVLFLISRLSPGLISRELKRALILIMCALATASAISAVYIDAYAKGIEDKAGKSDQVTVTVEECKYSYSYSSGYVVKVTKSDIIPVGTKLLLTTDKGYLPEGTILKGGVSYTSLSQRNSGTFDVKRYYNSKKIMLGAEDSSLETAGSDNSFSLTRIFRRLNQRLTAMIMAHCDREPGGLAAAVLLGNDEYLSDSTARDYRRIGISHLLVVSGSHFAVLIATADSIWKKLKVRRKTRSLINIVLIFFFMGITGFTTSVVRAGIMHLLAQLSQILFKKANTVNSLAISGTILILINPFAAFDVGMQLSFIAAYCCIMFQLLKGETFARFKNKLGFTGSRSKIVRAVSTVIETVILTSLINLCTLPIIWLYFGEASLLAVLANIVFIPLVTILMYLTVVHLVLYPLWIFIPVTSWLLNCLAGFLNICADKMASADWVVFPINYSFAIYFIAPICVLLLILPLLRGKHRLTAVFSAIIIASSMFITIQIVEYVDRDNIHFSYITSGKNDGFVMKSDGNALICDISDGSYSFAKKLTDEVSDLHVTEVDTLLITHYHNKHIQLISRVSDNEILRTIILPEPIDDREAGIYNSILKDALVSGFEVITIPAGGSFCYGDAVITLYPRTYLTRSTHPITAVRIEMGDEDALILSGSFNESETDLLPLAEQAEYLIFGVHSPVYKKAFGLDFSSTPKEIIVSEDAYEYMDESLREYAASFGSRNDSEVLRVTVKGNS
ncbi:MAG: ComEC/Rec2 family competence protein [Ruminococcaceae bacterium]|nr:ComEC/Rec2 family competence protein [Oscillospiraceae bacterium]